MCLLAGAVRAQGFEEFEHNTQEVDNLLAKARLSKNDADIREIAGKSLAIAREARYESGIISSLVLLGEACARAGNSEDALQYLLEAEEKVKASSNKATFIAITRTLGDVFLKEKMYDYALKYYRQVIALEPDDILAIEHAGDASLNSNQLDSAEYYYKNLTSRYRNEGNYPRLVQIYQKLANAYEQNNNLGKSIYYYTRIEDIIDRNGNPFEWAMLYNNLGKQYVREKNYPKAIEYFRKAELQCDYVSCDHPEVLYANLGIALHNVGRTKEGIDYLLRAQRIVSANNNPVEQANLEHLIAGVYFSNNDLYNALKHNDLSIGFARKTKQADLLINAYETAANIYHDLYDFEKAVEYYKEYLILLDSVRLEEMARQQSLARQRSSLAGAEGQIKYLIAAQNIREIALQNAESEKERLELLNSNLRLEAERKENDLLLLQKQKEVDAAQLKQQMLEALRIKAELRQRIEAERQSSVIAALRIEQANAAADSSRRAQELEILRRDKEYANLQLSKDETFRKYAYILGSLLTVILGLLGIGWLYARRASRRLKIQNRKIELQKAEIEDERQKSDQLLLNILPQEIAHELRVNGYANPRFYSSATVVFTDFLNFTSLSSQLSPEQLINELDECFLAFDEIAEKHQLEKIKTIGDAFMCAGGLPVPNDTHPIDAVRAALEMFDWLERRNRERPDAVFRNMRIGIHTGPVIAGVIGKNKFAYDIWGDAVNLAARLEELGEPGRINASGSTVEAVQHAFHYSYRGKKEVHNKGLVDMYFIEGEKSTPEG